ncbi:hypothetical protein A2U01_0080189, partial [Trifolium medium]|nr:hypothetical protein [Trifolium medium]
MSSHAYTYALTLKVLIPHGVCGSQPPSRQPLSHRRNHL